MEQPMIRRVAFAALTVATLMGCGVGSVAPVVTDADLIDEPKLAGLWTDRKETVEVTSTAPGNFHLVYTDEAGKVGRFSARYGRLGSYRVLDLQPDDPSPASNDSYKSLILRAHGIVFVASVSDSLRFQILEPDSVKALLSREPRKIAHAMTNGAVLLTASSEDSREFLRSFAGRPGALGEMNSFRRTQK
jgi:hypothetical protein